MTQTMLDLKRPNLVQDDTSFSHFQEQSRFAIGGDVEANEQGFRIFMTIGQPPVPEILAHAPSLFEIHPNGKVVVAGHRVPVFIVMQELEDIGESPYRASDIQSRFTGIDFKLLDDVTEFLDEHHEELQDFFVHEKRAAQQIFQKIERNRSGPTREELRERRKKRLESSQT